MRLKHIDSKDSLNLRRDGLYERRETRIVKARLKRGNTVVDVGAHIGYYTAIVSDIVGEEGQVYAFEPAPENARVLKLNLGELKYENVVFRQVAISDYCGKARLYLSQKSADNWLFKADGREYCEVQVASLDAIIKTEVDFLKIDVQGSESAVLRGAEELIRRSPSLEIMIEHSAVHLKMAGSSGQEMIEMLKDYGFRIFVIPKTGHAGKSGLISLSGRSIGKYRERMHVNLYCIKRRPSA